MSSTNSPNYISTLLEWRRHACIAIGLVLLASGLTALTARAADDNDQYQPVLSTFHVHSTVSTGKMSLDELAERAKLLGLDAIVLSENFVLRYDYGIWPLRGVLRWQVEYPSVLKYGIEEWLESVAETQARHPEILLIPGVEVAPHSYWTGSPRTNNLILHDAQRNLLVLGMTNPDDYASLPAAGSPAGAHFGWQTVLNLSPLLLLIPAAFLWRSPPRWLVPSRRQRMSIVKKKRAGAIIFIVTALLLLLYAWPFTQPLFSPYDDGAGYRPYQLLIDTAIEHGGAVFWSMTEAHNADKYTLGSMTVENTTESHAEVLLQTQDYSGFGGIYQDTRTLEHPGGIWDQTLNEYMRGNRNNPPVAVGEIAFHSLDHGGKDLDQVLTVFWVRERTEAAVVEALQTGRMYAVHQHQSEFGLRLDKFYVTCGEQQAMSGETLTADQQCTPTVRLRISAADASSETVRIRIIRSGEVVDTIKAEIPFDYEFTDGDVPVNESVYYRINVHGRSNGEILSNPIFVDPVPLIP